MIVKELIEHLKDLDPFMEVLVSQDAEGNRFRDLYEVSVNLFDGEDIAWDEDDDEDEDEASAEYPVSEVAILWPI